MVFVLGVAASLAAMHGAVLRDRLFVGPALAQKEPVDRQQYLLVLGIGNALASLAVDSERTALTLNETIDRVKTLDDRLQAAEKRIADLERKR
jgi:hypothetical protein